MTERQYLILALRRLRPGSNFILDEKGNIDWIDEVQTMPRHVEIDNMIKIMKAEDNKNDYKIQRKKEYSKLNQFEMIYDDMMNDTHNWEAAIKKIKEKYPKPN